MVAADRPDPWLMVPLVYAGGWCTSGDHTISVTSNHAEAFKRYRRALEQLMLREHNLHVHRLTSAYATWHLPGRLTRPNALKHAANTRPYRIYINMDPVSWSLAEFILPPNQTIRFH